MAWCNFVSQMSGGAAAGGRRRVETPAGQGAGLIGAKYQSIFNVLVLFKCIVSTYSI